MSIVKKGVLSHARVEKDGISYTPIYDGHILRSKEMISPDGHSLWNFANLFFNPRNPMLYRVLREKPAKDIVVIAFNPVILNKNGIFITTGNARAWQSEILTRDEGLLKIKEIQKNFKLERWANEDGSKTKIMAECLVPDRVPPEYLQEVYVVNHKVANDIKAQCPDIKVDIIPEPYMFFQPSWHESITNKLSLVEGDVFFSRIRTLTIAVNSVGVMGEGLARTKYHFLGAYSKHQDLPKQKKHVIGKPYIPKKEYSLDQELAEFSRKCEEHSRNTFSVFLHQNPLGTTR